jgi:hypothetical protein
MFSKFASHSRAADFAATPARAASSAARLRALTGALLDSSSFFFGDSTVALMAEPLAAPLVPTALCETSGSGFDLPDSPLFPYLIPS